MTYVQICIAKCCPLENTLHKNYLYISSVTNVLCFYPLLVFPLRAAFAERERKRERHNRIRSAIDFFLGGGGAGVCTRLKMNSLLEAVQERIVRESKISLKTKTTTTTTTKNRERDTHRQTDRQRQRQRNRQTETTDRDDRQTETDRGRQTDRQRQRELMFACEERERELRFACDNRFAVSYCWPGGRLFKRDEANRG